jgi:hypothetical protein
MNGRFAQVAVMRAAQRFAIYRNHLACCEVVDRLHPGHEAALKGFAIQAREETPKRIVGGNPVG